MRFMNSNDIDGLVQRLVDNAERRSMDEMLSDGEQAAIDARALRAVFDDGAADELRATLAEQQLADAFGAPRL